MFPQARNEGIVTEELNGDTLVYDLQSHRVHSLNRTAALVWRHSNGERTTVEIAQRVSGELEAPLNEQVVLLALARLKDARLLQETPGGVLSRRYTRRALASQLRLMGGLSVLLPVVTSMTAPTPAQAAVTCKPLFANCNSAAECCSQNCRNPGGQLPPNGGTICQP